MNAGAFYKVSKEHLSEHSMLSDRSLPVSHSLEQVVQDHHCIPWHGGSILGSRKQLKQIDTSCMLNNNLDLEKTKMTGKHASEPFANLLIKSPTCYHLTIDPMLSFDVVLWCFDELLEPVRHHMNRS